jgi:hypothetical protein
MHQTKPDGLIFVLAYLFILSLSAFFGGAILLGTAYPAVQQMGMGELPVLISGIAPLFLGILLSLSGWMLWRLKSAGRVLAIVLAVLMTVISGGSLPVLFLVGLEGIALYPPLITALLILASSLAVIAKLMRLPV